MQPGRELRNARGRAGLSQRALATRTGVAQPTIARIERGRDDPRVGTLDRLLRACNETLATVPLSGSGIDRTEIRVLLALTPGVKTFAELAVNAATFDLGDGVMVEVCDLDDLIRMKRAAGRPEDRIEVEILTAVREERARPQSEPKPDSA